MHRLLHGTDTLYSVILHLEIAVRKYLGLACSFVVSDWCRNSGLLHAGYYVRLLLILPCSMRFLFSHNFTIQNF